MYRNCSTDETSRRQRMLEECLLTAMEKKAFSEITVRELCRMGGVSRVAFYQYFNGKEGALCSLIDHTLQDYGTFSREGREAERFAAFWMTQSRLLEALDSSGLEHIFTRQTLALLCREEQSLRQSLGTGDQDCVSFAVYGICFLLFQWHRSGYQKSVPQFADLLERVLLQPLLAAR